MQAPKAFVVSLTLVGLGVSLASPAEAQQDSGTYVTSQPSSQPSSQPGSEPAQPPAGPVYPPPPESAQPYPGQPYPGQPYPVQTYPGPANPGQPCPGQPYPGGAQQPYYPAQPYFTPQPTLIPTQTTAVRYVEKPRTRMIIAGAAVLGLSWSLTALLTASYADSLYYKNGMLARNSITASGPSFGTASALWPLYIPLIGPWLELGYLSGSGSQLGGTLLAIDGVVQASGLVMMIVGAATRTRVAIYAKNNLTISPLTLSGGSGVLVGGRF